MVQDAIKAAAGGSSDAVYVLAEIARDSLIPPAVRVSAARAIVDLAIKGHELIGIEERLRALEAAAMGGQR